MPVIRLSNFEGRIPAISPKLLGERQAQTAENCKLNRGMIQPQSDALYDFTVSGLKVVDSNGNTVIDSSSNTVIAGQSRSFYQLVDKWLHWESEDIDVVKSFIPDSDNRIYFTGDGAPKQTNYTMATSGSFINWPASSYALGVPPPANKLTVTPQAGGTHTAKSLAYVYTYVTVWGEESAPSPPSDVVDVSEDNWIQITGFVAGIENVTHIRLYRLATGTELAEYQLVPYPFDNISEYDDEASYSVDDRVVYEGSVYICIQEFSYPPTHAPTDTDYWELDVSDCEIDDAVANGFDDKREDSYLGEVISVEDWDAPPTDLAGLHLFVNNILVGFSGSEVYFSLPNYPYVWPSDYAQRCTYDVIGIGHYAETLVVLTDNVPYQSTGTDPASLRLYPMAYKRPCKAKRGIVSTERGVIYPTDDGLFMINANGGSLLTKNLFTKEQWQALDITNIISAFWDDKVYIFFSGSGTGFYFHLDEMRVIDFSLSNKKIYGAQTFDDYLYVLVENQINNEYEVYIWAEAGSELTYTWKSKQFLYYSPFNFTAGMIVADGTVTFKLYVDGVLKSTKTVTDDNIFRLPSKYRGKMIEIELTGTSDVDLVAIATSINELIASLEEEE